MHGDRQAEVLKFGLGPSRGVAQKPHEIAKLVLDPRRDHREPLMKRCRELLELGIEAPYFRLTFTDRGGQARRRHATLNRRHEPLKPLGGLFSLGSHFRFEPWAIVDQSIEGCG